MTKPLIIALVAAFAKLGHVVASPATAKPNEHPSNGICTDISVTEEVSSEDPVWGGPRFQDDFDLIAFLFNTTRKDQENIPPSVSGFKNATNTYTVSATFCTPKTLKEGKEKTVLLATHGLWYDGR